MKTTHSILIVNIDHPTCNGIPHPIIENSPLDQDDNGNIACMIVIKIMQLYIDNFKLYIHVNMLIFIKL